MKENFIMIFLVSALVIISACTSQSGTPATSEFEQLCKTNGNEWMEMEEMRNGEFVGGAICVGCMADTENHFCNVGDYLSYEEKQSHGGEGHMMEHEAMTAHAGINEAVKIHTYNVTFTRPIAEAGEEVNLQFVITEDGKP